jgi:Na+/proline symporter
VPSIVLVLGWKLMGPAGAFPGLSSGFAGGIVALVSILRLKERAASVAAALVPFAFTVVYLVAELIVGSSGAAPWPSVR